GILHHGQLHLYTGERKPRLWLVFPSVLGDGRRAVTRQDAHGTGKIRAESCQQVEVVSRPDIPRMVPFHRFAQFVFRKKVGEEGWQGAGKGFWVLAKSTGRSAEGQAEYREAASRAVSLVKAEGVEIARRPDDGSDLEVVQKNVQRRD